MANKKQMMEFVQVGTNFSHSKPMYSSLCHKCNLAIRIADYVSKSQKSLLRKSIKKKSRLRIFSLAVSVSVGIIASFLGKTSNRDMHQSSRSREVIPLFILWQ